MVGFCEVFDDVTKQGTKIPSNLYLKEGTYPIIDQGQADIAGYANTKEGLFTDVPAIIFGDHTRIIKYVDTPCFLGADGVKLLKAKDKKANYKYLYYALCNVSIPNTGYNRHFKWLKEVEIPEYSTEKQNEIVEKLEKTDDLISLRKQQLAKLDELIKAKFVEMFGDMLLNPLIWPEKPLESMAGIVSGITKGRKTKSTELFEVPYMAVSNVKDGYIDWTTVKTILATQSEIDQYRILPKDVLMTEGGDPDKLGRGAIIRELLENCIHQNHIFRVRLDRGTILPEFFSEYLQHQKAKRYFLRCAKQTTGIASINMKQLRALPVLLPPIGKQGIFADFAERIRQQKLTIQQGLDKLEVLKKSLMQEYFGKGDMDEAIGGV